MAGCSLKETLFLRHTQKFSSASREIIKDPFVQSCKIDIFNLQCKRVLSPVLQRVPPFSFLLLSSEIEADLRCVMAEACSSGRFRL